MRYRLESGVVLEKVAGHDLLITYGEPGRDRMPYVLQVNETGAFFWRLLEKGESPEEIRKDEMCFPYFLRDFYYKFLFYTCIFLKHGLI